MINDIDLHVVLVANGAAILLMIMVTLSSLRMNKRGLFDYKLFNLMVILNIVQCIIELILYTTADIISPEIYAIRFIITPLMYIGNTIFSYIWALYADYKLFLDINRIRRRGKFLAIPALFIIFCSIINLFTPMFFRFDENYYYHRTNLYIVPNIVAGLYLAYGIVLVYRYKNKIGKYLFLPVTYFIITIITATVLDFVFYGLSVKMLGTAIALASLYMNTQNELIYTDSLSGLLNRQYMVNFLQKEINHPESDRIIAGIMMDIDHFKAINDTYGHLSGDETIRAVGQLIKSSLTHKDIAIRYAGDEFMVIQTVNDKQEILNTITAIHSAFDEFNKNHSRPYNVSISIGYSIFDREKDTIDTFFSRMDEAMYKEKEEKHRKSDAFVDLNLNQPDTHKQNRTMA